MSSPEVVLPFVLDAIKLVGCHALLNNAYVGLKNTENMFLPGASVVDVYDMF